MLNLLFCDPEFAPDSRQVMQEKAAHRLLAQALHHQMLEELHNNPALAADPDQQLHFKRLAQQQLLYQMALAAQAATPRDELQATAGARVASDVQPNGTNRDGMDQDTMESAWGEMHYIGSRWASERQRFSNTAMNEEALYGQPERVSLPLNDIFGAIGTAEVVSVTHSDRHEIRACQIRVESSGIGVARPCRQSLTGMVRRRSARHIRRLRRHLSSVSNCNLRVIYQKLRWQCRSSLRMPPSLN